ncbi:CPXCG motif-containing cysteine-rich protein [Pseudohongiella sp.]|uniref:CPXCG motif-containing cysteine-rich protein n=1 Tax=marine sediment metagenome TaxID=412755 RepID=A0A0F9YKM5_9ZZZZ|nr:CPXCG motif-containing cysteine-rich protein [Pseudohongiella sp.]HDZ08168.1 CPXCG motif-containing cysteine-rich protein [Pseudohongiella sp.]HEA63136.1 CPXCG motif-containing cysteine-rich protein [Pseudohongiella sp.]
MLTELATLQCPYCWESIEVVVDCSVTEQEYTEDCSVCCRPIIISVYADGGELQTVEARSEDD